MWRIKSKKLRKMLPRPTDRAFFVGMTGTGKTTLAEIICNEKKYVVVLDTKGEIDWKGYHLHERLDSLTKDKHPKLIYRPNPYELQNETTVDNFFLWIYTRENTTVYIDEVYSICQNNNIPFHLLACLTRGRSKNICVYSSSQRPKDLPQTLMSEAENYYVFKLNMPQDRKKIYEITGIKDDNVFDLKKRFFIYANVEAGISNPQTLTIRKVNNNYDAS